MLTRRSFGRGLAVAGAIVALSAGAKAADYSWKFQTFWQPGTVNQQAFERFAADVAEKSDGRIEIEALPVNAVVPPGEMLDAVAADIIQGMNGGTGYFVGKDAGFALLADFNAGYESPQQLTAWFHEGGGMEIAQELYGQFGVHYLGPVLWGAESIPTKNPLRQHRRLRRGQDAGARGAWGRRSFESSASAFRRFPAPRSTPRWSAARSRRPTGVRSA